MSNLKTKEFKITDEALKVWNLPKDAEVLDIGCGQGETVEYLEKKYGYKVCGIDFSKEIIEQGLKRNPKLDIRHGDGEFLDGFLSYSFDGVMMKSTLSLIGLPDEALHEAYCVLKKGGKLFITDFYFKDPDSEFLKSVALEAEIERNTPHDHDHDHNHEGGCGSGHSEDGQGDQIEAKTDCSDCSDCSDCGECSSVTHDHEHDHDNIYLEEPRYRAVNFRSNGRFLIAPLLEELKEIGYINIEWKDCPIEKDIKHFLNETLNPNDKYATGYFMLTAEKPL